MTTERLLVVEDEAHIAEVVADNLEMEGWQVEVARDGASALQEIRKQDPDLVILDIMLPHMDGFQVCQTLRREGNHVPILFLTARNSRDDRIRGLESGGDDYLTKPFEMQELILRIRAILRRKVWFSGPSPAGEELTLGDARVNFAAFAATVKDQVVVLSEKETMILRCLAERPGEVVSRDDILNKVWGYEAFPTTRTVDNFIVRLRRILEPDPKNPRYIHTVRGTGYRLTP